MSKCGNASKEKTVTELFLVGLNQLSWRNNVTNIPLARNYKNASMQISTNRELHLSSLSRKLSQVSVDCCNLELRSRQSPPPPRFYESINTVFFICSQISVELFSEHSLASLFHQPVNIFQLVLSYMLHHFQHSSNYF